MFKVIDLFAGPGGLSEGFSAYQSAQGQGVFDVALSIEKDPVAFETLKLRAFYREFDVPPLAYYEHVRGELDRQSLYDAFPCETISAEKRIWNVPLGPGGIATDRIRARVKSIITDEDPWVLIGGPPCQAYSLIGRARNKGNSSYDAGQDVRQRLYVEYLQILADHAPPVFIMENVKGLLSANVEDIAMFDRILSDLRDPSIALRREERRVAKHRRPQYKIYSITTGEELTPETIASSVVRAEQHGIPQARHRVILLGVRVDALIRSPKKLTVTEAVPLSKVFGLLPPVRSGVSKTADSADLWVSALRSQTDKRWANAGARKAGGEDVAQQVAAVLKGASAPKHDRGGEFVAGESESEYCGRWFSDHRLGGALNHATRAHIAPDLYRYMYAACFAGVRGRSPVLKEFPADLLPDHVSAAFAVKNGGHFADRFRVQVEGRPSTTIVSHISKDGHYYIHPDPHQCRSLTVREAARLQTFPDNYFFCGPRTAQFVQVGNAVPPLLAVQIAEIVYDLIIGM